MGSPGSPAYANCICMYYEHIFSKSLKEYTYLTKTVNLRDRFVTLRYVDDTLTVIAYDKRSPFSKLLAKSIINLYKKSYHKNMKLKAESTKIPWPFLEGLYEHIRNKNHPDTITIKYNSIFLNTF